MDKAYTELTTFLTDLQPGFPIAESGPWASIILENQAL